MRTAQRGAMLVFAAGMLMFLSTAVIVAIDVGRIMSVRNELQNAADASALAGANCLAREPLTGSSVDCTATLLTSGAPQWDRAKAKAADHLGQNKSEGVAFETTGTGHTIEAGFWNLQERKPTGGTFSTAPTVLGTFDYPAVRVLLRRDEGVNNGPIALFLRMFSGGPPSMPMQAEAVAVIPPPASAPPNKLIPVVINECMFDLYWDKDKGEPKIYNGPGSTPADPYGLSTPGKPYTIRIGSAYHYFSCLDAGQWTTFDLDTNSGADVKALVESGNPNPLSVDQTVKLKPGVEASAYKPLGDLYSGSDVNILVVNAPGNDLTPTGGAEGSATIAAFAGFHIDAVKGGSDKYIEGHFIKTTVLSGGSGAGGTFYGTYSPPRLAR